LNYLNNHMVEQSKGGIQYFDLDSLY
jgi:hypothetical protein